MGRFGPYGGRYVPETLIPALEELAEAYRAAQEDPAFWEELAGLFQGLRGAPLSPLSGPGVGGGGRHRSSLSEEGGPESHRSPQDQQHSGAGSPGSAHGESPDHRRNGGRPARGSHRHRLLPSLAWTAWSTWGRRTYPGRP